MTSRKSPVYKMVMKIPLINAGGNLSAIAVTFIYFAVIEPGVSTNSILGQLCSKAAFLLYAPLVLAPYVTIVIYMIMVPVWREANKAFLWGEDSFNPNLGPQDYRSLAAKMIDLPLKFAASISLGWIIVGLCVLLVSEIAPQYYPWKIDTAPKMSVAIIFVGAPVTALVIFFLQERWIREILKRHFPKESIKLVPGSIRISSLQKLMVVSLTLGTLPVAVVATVALLRAHEFGDVLNPFVYQMHVEIIFLVLVWACVAVILSIFLSKSISLPLREATEAMEKIEQGERKVLIPVVSNDEIGFMAEGFNRMVDGLRERDEIRETFGMYVSPEVAKEALAARRGLQLEGAMREISILVSDLRGFTSMTDSTEPSKALLTLNRYLTTMTGIIHENHGTIDEFTGDGILVFFGAPNRLENHALAALMCAMEMQRAMIPLNQENHEMGLPRLEMGIAINCGELIVGNIGSDKRKKYGALGTPINMAFRVESLAGPGDILITEAIYGKLVDKPVIKEQTEVSLKGIQEKVRVYSVMNGKMNDRME